MAKKLEFPTFLRFFQRSAGSRWITLYFFPNVGGSKEARKDFTKVLEGNFLENKLHKKNLGKLPHTCCYCIYPFTVHVSRWPNYFFNFLIPTMLSVLHCIVRVKRWNEIIVLTPSPPNENLMKHFNYELFSKCILYI